MPISEKELEQIESSYNLVVIKRLVKEVRRLSTVVKAAQEYKEAVLSKDTYSPEEVLVLFDALEKFDEI